MSLRKIRLAVLVALYAALMAGCGPVMVSVAVVRPAQVDLAGIDKIMIGGISGNGGAFLAKDLSLRIAGHPHYTLLDDAHFKGLIAKGYTVEFGGTAFLQGNIVKHNYSELITPTVVDKPQGKKETRYKKTGTATVEAVLKVVDPNSGKILGMRHLRKYSSVTLRSVNEKPRAINKSGLLGSARAKIVSEFMKLIVPYRERIGLTFAEEKNIPEMEGAIQIIKAHQWQPAINEFQRIADTYANTPGVSVGPAYFNIGLSHVVLKDYDTAVEFFSKAMRFSPALANRCGWEISRAKRLKSDVARLKQQMEGTGGTGSVTIAKQPTVEPEPVVKETPVIHKPPVTPKPRPTPKSRGIKIHNPNSWTSGGVEARLLEISVLSPNLRSVFKMPIQVTPGNKLVGVKGKYKNLSQGYKNYAFLKMSITELPELTLSTDKGKTYFRSMHTLGLMIPFGGLKPGKEHECWTVFEIPQNEKPEKLMAVVTGKTLTWTIGK